jgi:hypothetical protein
MSKPFIKVTDVIGELDETFDNDREPVWLLYAEEDDPSCHFIHDMSTLCPKEATAESECGPRGRFRIEVSFWPEEQK